MARRGRLLERTGVAAAEKGSPLERSRRQERSTAKDVGGSVTPGSGNQWHSKGDVSARDLLVENKTTSHRSYSLKLDELEKIKVEALNVGKVGVLQVDIGGKRFAVVEWATLLAWKAVHDGTGRSVAEEGTGRRVKRRGPPGGDTPKEATAAPVRRRGGTPDGEPGKGGASGDHG